MLRKTEVIQFKQVEHIMSEKEILTALSEDPHPFIVNLAGSFQDDCCLYMVIEIVIGGEFFSHLRNAVKFDNNTAKFFASHVVLIFEHLDQKEYHLQRFEARGKRVRYIGKFDVLQP